MRAAALPLLLGSAAAGAAGLTVDQIYTKCQVLDRNSVIVETSHPHDADMCRGFSLTESQVRDFFKKAKVITPQDRHDVFEWAPCEVEGYFIYQDQKFSFSINAAATGMIEIAPNQYVYFGCIEVCKNIFDYGYDTSGNADAE